jgi:tetratricopeptide (TPR) repeat protein
MGDIAQAEPLLRENVATNLHVLGVSHPNTAAAKSSLALLLLAKGEVRTAEALLREARDAYALTMGKTSIQYAHSLANLAAPAEAQGRLGEARALLEEAIRLSQPLLAADHPRFLGYTVNLARVRIESGDGASTEASLREALASRQKVMAQNDWRISQAQALLGASLLAQGRMEEAEPLMLAADAILKPIPGPQARERSANRARLVKLYTALGRPTDAAAFR